MLPTIWLLLLGACLGYYGRRPLRPVSISTLKPNSTLGPTSTLRPSLMPAVPSAIPSPRPATLISSSLARATSTVTMSTTLTESVRVTETQTVTVTDCETTVTVTVRQADIRPVNEPISIADDKEITFGQFNRAISFYNLTSAGGFPPPPSRSLYEGYLRHVSPHLDLPEQAMLLANLIWESAGFQHREELACKGVSRPTPRCPYGLYHGRGWIQLSWDYNYRSASRAIFGDMRLYAVPDILLKDDVAWQTAVWYWKENVRPRLLENDAIESRSFGYSVRAINGQQECTSIPKSTLKNLRRHPKINHQAAFNRLAIFNAILVDWNLATDESELGSLDGCLIEDPESDLQSKLEYLDGQVQEKGDFIHQQKFKFPKRALVHVGE